MKTLEQVRNDVLIAYGYKDIRDFVTQALGAYDARTPIIMEDIAKEYAKEAVKQLANNIKKEL